MASTVLSFQDSSQSIGSRSFDPIIATALRSDRLATIVQQVHYMGQRGLGEIVDGMRWIFNSYRAWLQEMPWLSMWELRKAFEKLRDMGVLKFQRLKERRFNQTGWYALDYKLLRSIVKDCSLSVDSHGCVNPLTSTSEPSHIDLMTVLTSDPRPPIPKNQIQDPSSKENNNTAADIFDDGEIFSSEESEQDELPEDSSFVSKEENQANGVKSNCPKDQGSAAARDNNALQPTKQEEQEQFWKLDWISIAGIVINKQLEKAVKAFTEKEVQMSVTCYQENLDYGKVIANPQGWLIECLRGKWWENSPKKVERRLEEAKITKVFAAYGVHSTESATLSDFFLQYWEAVDNNYLCDFDEQGYQGERVGYLLVQEENVFVCTLDDNMQYAMMPFSYIAKNM